MPRAVAATKIAFTPLTRGKLGIVRLTLPEPPSANRWWRNVPGKTLLSRIARSYKADVYGRARIEMLAQGLRTIERDVPVVVRLDWYRGRKAGDLDKRIGIVLDAIQGVVYASDAQIIEITATRWESPDAPRLCIQVRPVV